MTLTWWRVRAAQQSRKPRFRPTVEALEDRCVPAVDVILEWNAVMLQANAVDHSLAAPEQGGPTLTARAFAIVSAAMYDAYNSVHPTAEPYLTVASNADHASSAAAVAQAAHDTLASLFPSQGATFDAALTQTLARVPDGAFEDRGRAVGSFVAGRILQARAHDNADSIQGPPYVPNGQPGFHNVDPLHPGQGFYAPDYQSVTPFALRSAEQFGPLALDDGTPAGRAAFLRSPAYTRAYYEVFALGGDGVTTPTLRTPEQTTVGIFWGYDGRPGLGTPPRLYDQIVRTVAAQEHNTEAQNARLFALVNIAMADAGLACWDRKYDDAFWRPVLGTRGGNADGNPLTVGLPNWAPLGAQASNPRPGETNFTPNFPSYTSGHATFGAATFQTLARFYGRDDITFTVHSDEFNGVTRGADGQVRPVVTRTFHSFSAAAEENGQSRIYLGIHWAFDKVQGIQCGDHIADYVFSNFLRPLGGAGPGGGFSPALVPDTPAALDGTPALPDGFRVAVGAAGPAASPGQSTAVQVTAAAPTGPGVGGPFAVTVYQPPEAASAADTATQFSGPGQTAAGSADALWVGWGDDALRPAPFAALA
jgi:hypothetical protein